MLDRACWVFASSTRSFTFIGRGMSISMVAYRGMDPGGGSRGPRPPLGPIYIYIYIYLVIMFFIFVVRPLPKP